MNPPLTTRRVLLGLFIVWQLVFVVGKNLNDLAHHLPGQLPQDWKGSVNTVAPGWQQKRHHANDVSHLANEVANRYIHLTGQEQIWSLFSPGGWRDSAFVAVEFRWDDAPPGAPGHALILSDNEPASVHGYFRWGKFRLRRIEGRYDLYLYPEHRRDWATAIENHVRSDNDSLHAYLDWHFRQFFKENPRLGPPKQVILHVRRYHTAEVDEAPPYLTGPFSTPVARWQPGAKVEAGYLAVEAYDPDSRRFVRLRPE